MWPWDGSAAFGEASSSTSAVEDLSWNHDHASWTDRGYAAATPNGGTRSLAPFPPYLVAALRSFFRRFFESVAEIVFAPEYLARQGYGYASYNPDGGHMAEGAEYQHADDLYAPPWSGADHDLMYRRLSESCDSGSVFPFSMGVSIVIVVVLVMMSGLFSGLTLGLMGLDITGLDIIAHSDDKKAAANARKIIPVRKSGNFLLCTLLLGNVAVNSMLSIVMADLTSGTTGFIVSTAIIVVFGEILPQASCSRYALQIGAATAWIVRILQFLLGILAWPLSYALDIILGDEMGTIHSKQELRRLLQIHVQQGALKKEEGDVVAGALKFRNKPLSKVMTQKEDCFMLNQSEVLDYATLLEISNSGFSRIPVYNKTDSDIVGVLVTKDLIFVDPEDAMPLRQFLKVFGRHVERFYADDTCGDALHRFKLGRAHLGLVVKKVRRRVSDPRHIKAPPAPPVDHVSDHGSESASGGTAAIENATGLLVNANSSAGGEKEKKDPAGFAQSGNKQPSHPKKDSHHSSATNSSGQTQDHVHVRIQGEQEQATQFVLQGIVTLEDVIEEILQDEIVDETDVFIDMHNKEERDFVESEEAVLPPEESRNRNKLNNSMGSSNRGGGHSFDDVDHTSSKGSDWHGDDRSDFGGAKPSPLSGPSDSFVGKPLLEATAQALLSPMAVAGAMVGAVAGTMESERSGGEPTGRNVRPMGDASEDNILSRQETNEKEAGGGTAGSGAAGAAGSFQQGGATSSTARAMGSGSSRPGGTPTGGVSGAASGVYPPAGAGGGGSTAGGAPTRTNPGQASTGLHPTPGGNQTSNHSGTNYDATEDTYSYTKSDGRFTPGLGHGEDISLMDSVSRLRPVGRQSRRGKRRQREDITRLRFFNPSIRGDALLPQEVDVLVSHLLENYEGPGFDLSTSVKEHSTANPVDGSPPEEGDPKPYRTPWLSQRWRNDEERTEGRTKWISRHALNWLLIERGNVEVLYRNAPARCPRPDKEDWIYRRGQEVDFMTIILTGVVMIIVGRDGFQQECGAFSVLGIDALAASSAFAPDFSAALWSDVVTLVRISRDMYEEARALEARDQIPFVEPAVNPRIKRATKHAEASEISRGRPHRKVQQRAVSRDYDREREREDFEDVVDDDRSPKEKDRDGKLHGSSSSSSGRTGGAFKNQQDYLRGQREERVSAQSASDLFEKDSNYKYQDEYDSPKKIAGGTADRNRRGDHHNDRRNSKDQVKPKDSFLGLGGGKKESSILGSFFSAFEPRKRSKLASAAAEVPAQPSRMW